MDEQVQRDWEAMLQAWEKMESEMLRMLNEVRRHKTMLGAKLEGVE